MQAPLCRRFTKVGTEPTTAFARRMLGDRSGDPWESIVPIASPSSERSAVVVLAPSGVGKSSELESRAAALREAGVPSFFVRAVDVAATGVVGSMADPSVLAQRTAPTHFPRFLHARQRAQVALGTTSGTGLPSRAHSARHPADSHPRYAASRTRTIGRCFRPLAKRTSRRSTPCTRR